MLSYFCVVTSIPITIFEKFVIAICLNFNSFFCLLSGLFRSHHSRSSASIAPYTGQTDLSHQHCADLCSPDLCHFATIDSKYNFLPL